MLLRTLRFLIRSDLHRYAGNSSGSAFLREYWRTPGFRFSVWFRIYQFARSRRLLTFGPRQLCSFKLTRLTYRFGIAISPDAEIGPGLYIGHFGGIVVNEAVRIGRNCNLSHDVTIGQMNRGRRAGVPVVGDEVYIAPGAKVIGGIRVGNRVAIGANAVVNSDVPDDAVVGGIPARVLSQEG